MLFLKCFEHLSMKFGFFILVSLMFLSGCVSDQVENDQPELTAYQQSLIDKGPQHRGTDETLGVLTPPQEPNTLLLPIVTDPNTGRIQIHISVEEAIKRALVNSPEISVISYDPSIAKEEVTQAVSIFDPDLFGEFNYEDADDPTDSVSLGGRFNTRLWEAGFKQQGTTGAEWSLGYALTRNWDNATNHTLPKSYNPIVTFQLRQPLLRDAWKNVNLAGVDIAKLNYKIALADFRKRTEAVSTDVISLYWTLKQIRTDRQTQQDLLRKTEETLQKVQDRKDIDASLAQIKQAETSYQRRLSSLYDIERQMVDIQDQFVRLLSDNQINLLDDYEIIPLAEPLTEKAAFDQSNLLRTAMTNNPDLVRAALAVEIAQINVNVARQQKMPKLDLVALTRVSGLDDTFRDAQDYVYDTDYTSYAVGVTIEIPLGNRQREAEYRKRLLAKSKALTQQWNLSDQVAISVKAAIRLAETSYNKIDIQRQAVQAAETYLQALEDTEVIRAQLTPEFLLVKLQAQESLANASRRYIKAIADYNIALTRLAQTTGTVLDMRYVKNVMANISGIESGT